MKKFNLALLISIIVSSISAMKKSNSKKRPFSITKQKSESNLDKMRESFDASFPKISPRDRENFEMSYFIHGADYSPNGGFTELLQLLKQYEREYPINLPQNK